MKVVRVVVTLLGAVPEVKRVLAVQESLTLDCFHRCLQLAMGWHNCHLHAFYGAGCEWGGASTLAELVAGTGGKDIIYEYDHGDCWEHLIEVGDRMDPESGVAYPQLAAAVNRCPPENCGGVDGYRELLAALADPKHPDHGDMTDWVGGRFDPLEADESALKGNVDSFAKELASVAE